jgi:acid phosphatase (class A)
MKWVSRAASALAAALLLAAFPVSAQEVEGYLAPAELPSITAWLPAPPAEGSPAEKADVDRFLATRPLLTRPEGARAHLDMAYAATAVAPRFAETLGVSLDARNAPTFMRLMARVTTDIEDVVAPIKISRAQGGRVRPFVRYPGQPTCTPLYPGIEDTGSYPSTHAALGWLWGAILAELAPDLTDRLLARGLQYGESRVICGFHYDSDIAAGRLAAAALLVRLHADPEFRADLNRARAEIEAARGRRKPAFRWRLPKLPNPLAERR